MCSNKWKDKFWGLIDGLYRFYAPNYPYKDFLLDVIPYHTQTLNVIHFFKTIFPFFKTKRPFTTLDNLTT